MKPITLFAFITLLLSLPNTTFCRHIIGGTFSYNIIKVENQIATIDVNLYLYKDKDSETLFDQNIHIGIHKYIDNNYLTMQTPLVELTSVSPIIIDNIDGCSNNMIKYDLGTYSFQVEILLNDFDHFKISYQRCCRDILISNIKFPNETGIAIAFDLFPEAFNHLNQTFSMSNSFPALIEVGQNTSFDVSVDDDFDKNYYLSIPKVAGGPLGATVAGDPFDCLGITPDPAVCIPDFESVEYINPNFQYGEGASLSLDSESGELMIDIPEVSKILVGVTLDRYNDGNLISRIRQQFVINSINCFISNTHNKFTSELKIWPIPSNGKIYFESPLKEIKIYNTDGNQQPFDQKVLFSRQLDLSVFPKGVFFINGQTQDGIWVLKKIILLD